MPSSRDMPQEQDTIDHPDHLVADVGARSLLIHYYQCQFIELVY